MARNLLSRKLGLACAIALCIGVSPSPAADLVAFEEGDGEKRIRVKEADRKALVSRVEISASKLSAVEFSVTAARAAYLIGKSRGAKYFVNLGYSEQGDSTIYLVGFAQSADAPIDSLFKDELSGTQRQGAVPKYVEVSSFAVLFDAAQE